jgi:hypothetical protein
MATISLDLSATRDHVDGRPGPALLIGAPERLAVDGNDVRAEPGERRHPGDEAVLKLLRVEDGEDVAELVVRGRAVAARPEAAQEVQFLLTETGDLDPALTPGEHAEKTQQQHLIERIEHLCALPRVLESAEMLQEINNLIERLVRRPMPAHHVRDPPCESKGSTAIQMRIKRINSDSDFSPLVTRKLTRSPWVTPASTYRIFTLTGDLANHLVEKPQRMSITD